MFKQDIISRMAAESGLSKVNAEKALNAFITVTTDALASEDDVNIKGFGAFKVVPTKERTGVNPKTKEPITIPASVKVSFKASSVLKGAVR